MQKFFKDSVIRLFVPVFAASVSLVPALAQDEHHPAPATPAPATPDRNLPALQGMMQQMMPMMQQMQGQGISPQQRSEMMPWMMPMMSQMMAMMQGSMQSGAGNSMKGMESMAPKGDSGPSSQALAAANAKMHDAMDIAYTGNADVDFVKGMIPHHQGAIDMAGVVLNYGKDPDVRKLAEAVIEAQNSEITWMADWLKKQGR